MKYLYCLGGRDMGGRLARVAVACALALGWIMGAVSTEAAAPHTRTRKAVSVTQAVEQQVLKLLNADRAANGLGPLQFSVRLTMVARAHSADMAWRSYFAHVTPEGRTAFQRMAQAGIYYSMAGENLGMASGYPPLRAARVIEAQMMAEPPNQENHRAIILSRALHTVGVGVRLTARGTIYITEDFTN